MNEPDILRVSGFHAAPREQQDRGLLGWITCTVNGALRLDGIAVRRTAAGTLTLSYPERRDSAGRRHALIRPIDNDTRKAIETAVFAALAAEGVDL